MYVPGMTLPDESLATQKRTWCPQPPPACSCGFFVSSLHSVSMRKPKAGLLVVDGRNVPAARRHESQKDVCLSVPQNTHIGPGGYGENRSSAPTVSRSCRT